MALPIARAAGNRARANPRLYSTSSDASFTHRNTPPMPEIGQPKGELVTLLSHRIHSVLGSAWHSLTTPMTSWMPKLQKTAKAPLVEVAEAAPQFVERALQVVFESERGWSWGRGSGPEDEFGGRVMLYNVVPPRKPMFKNNNMTPVDSYERAADLSSRDLYLCSAADVAITTMQLPRFYNRKESTAELDTSRSFVYELTRPHVAMVQLPNAEYRGLDDGIAAQTLIEPVPYHPLFASPRAQLVALAVVAASVAIASSVAAVGSFLRKPW